METEDVMNNSDFLKMNRKQLAKTVSRLASIANKRIKRLQKLDVESPALLAVMESGGKFSTANKSLNQLRAEFKRVSKFLEYRTSTVSGFRAYRVRTLNRLGLTEETTSKELERDIWKAYRRIEEYSPAILKSYGSEEMQQYVSEQAQKGKSVDSVVEASISELNRWYERQYTDEWVNLNGANVFDMGENDLF